MEWFLKVVRDNYANFKGRARRKEYWMFALFFIIIMFVLGFISGLLTVMSSTIGGIFATLMWLVYLALLVPALAVSVRRMHDVGKEWYFMLIPIYNLILSLTEGDRGPNEFGPDPKGDENADPFADQRPSGFGNTQSGSPESDNNNTF